MKTDNVIVDKSKAFALKVIALYKKLCDTNREFVMSKQLLKSGTSIGANIKEAQQGQSKADFYAKLYISLKEASETEYWLELLQRIYRRRRVFCNLPRVPRNHQNPRRYNETQGQLIIMNYELILPRLW